MTRSFALPWLVVTALIAVVGCGSPAPIADGAAADGAAVGTGTSTGGAPTYARPAALADLPIVELVGPAVTGAGPVPVFEWRPLAGADTYLLSVRGPDRRGWAWSGGATSIRYGGVVEGQSGPTIVPGMYWSVAAFDAEGPLLALSELRPVSPTDDPGPAPDWLAAAPVASAAAPSAAPPAGVSDACDLFSADEITAAIDGTWGTPEFSDYGGGSGRCEWTSANGTILAIDVMPADTYDPEGWDADGTIDGLGEQSYIVSHGWDRRIGFVRGGRSVTLSIDWTRVDLEAFAGIARTVEQRLP